MTIDDLILKAGYLFAYCNEQSTQDSGWGHSSATFAAGRLVYDLLCLRVAPHLFQGPIAREGEGQRP